MTEQNLRLRSWVTATIAGAYFCEHGYDSIHLDDLVDDYSEADAVEVAFRVFGDLIRCYEDYANDVAAMLVIVLSYEDQLNLQAPRPGEIAASWDHFTPPVIYLEARKPDLIPCLAEEYRKSFAEGVFAAPHGVCHGYYRCHRNEGSTEFTRGVYVKHYPLA